MLVILLCACALALAACTNGGPVSTEKYATLDAYPAADMSSYDCDAGYQGEYQFVNMTVKEVAAEMEAGSTFMVYAGFNKCPWCNVMLNPINDIALERGIKIAYIDTRADPSWKSNLDLLDYDLFVELFGSTLKDDDNGIPHLYVPHCFYIKDGQLVGDNSGTVPSQSSPDDPLSEEQLQEYRSIVNGHLDKILS